MNYDEMSDFEINKAVSVALGEKIPEGWEDSPWYYKTENTMSELNGDGTKIEKTIIRGYCNNPAVAWPIIVENKIGIEPVTCDDGEGAVFQDEWTAENAEPPLHYVEHQNPLRAAMIVYLKIQEKSK